MRNVHPLRLIKSMILLKLSQLRTITSLFILTDGRRQQQLLSYLKALSSLCSECNGVRIQLLSQAYSST